MSNQQTINFLDTADSRETSPELMESIFFVAGRNDTRAARIWSEPTDEEVLAIWEHVTGNGNLDASDFVWGAAGNNWFE